MRLSGLDSKYLKNRAIDSKTTFKNQKNFSIKPCIRKSKKNFFSDLELKKITDSKLFQKTIKLFLSDTCIQFPTIFFVNNENVISDDFELAKTFNSYFEKILIELGVKEYENLDTNPNSRSQDDVDITINIYKNHSSTKIINIIVSFESRLNINDINEFKIPKEMSNHNSRRWECLIIYLQKYVNSVQMFVMQYLEIYGILKYQKNKIFLKI